MRTGVIIYFRQREDSFSIEIHLPDSGNQSWLLSGYLIPRRNLDPEGNKITKNPTLRKIPNRADYNPESKNFWDFSLGIFANILGFSNPDPLDFGISGIFRSSLKSQFRIPGIRIRDWIWNEYTSEMKNTVKYESLR